MFIDRYDVWLSEAPHVRLPDGEACFPGVQPVRRQAILAAHGLNPGPAEMLAHAARRQRHAVATRA